MLGSVLQYVLGIVFGFFGAVLLLRAWLYYWALSPRHPLCELTRKITDWLVAPRYANDFNSLVNDMRQQAVIFEKEYYETNSY